MLMKLAVICVCLATPLLGTYVFVHRFARHLRASGRREKPNYSDVGIVLGAYTDGYRPSRPLQSRLRVAIRLFREGVVTALIVSGGKGDDETVSEARSMTRFLVMNGLPYEAIVEEPMSRDTWENLKNSQQIMTRCGFKNAVIMTSDYHLPRALAAARHLGMTVSGAPAISRKHEHRFAVREVFANIQYTLKGRSSLF